MFAYKRLKVYQKALLWVVDVYKLAESFPPSEKFALVSQIHRACVSVTSNIAEGSGRTSIKDSIHFLEISFGSLMEVQSQLEIAKMLSGLRLAKSKQIN